MEAHIFSLAPQLFTYALSFILLGVFCGLTTSTLRRLRVLTQFLWINLICLMFVALAPFSNELMGNSTGLAASNMFFHVNMFIIGVLLTLNWFYSYHRGLLSVERKEILQGLTHQKPFTVCSGFTGNGGNPILPPSELPLLHDNNSEEIFVGLGSHIGPALSYLLTISPAPDGTASTPSSVSSTLDTGGLTGMIFQRSSTLMSPGGTGARNASHLRMQHQILP